LRFYELCDKAFYMLSQTIQLTCTYMDAGIYCSQFVSIMYKTLFELCS